MTGELARTHPSLPLSAHQVDAIVFLVDAADRERFHESKKELDSLLSDDSLATVPFLILGNKIDIPAAGGWLQLQAGLPTVASAGWQSLGVSSKQQTGRN